MSLGAFLVMAAVAFVFSAVGRAVTRAAAFESASWYLSAAGVVSVVAVGAVLQSVTAGGIGWLLAAAALGGLLAGWRGSWRIVPGIGALGVVVMLAFGARASGLGIGLIVTAAAWVPGALVLALAGAVDTKKAAGVVVVLLALVGAGSLLFGGGVSHGVGGHAQVLEEKPAVANERPAVESVPSCECAAGAVCVGPRGGRYCLRADGSKNRLVTGE